MTITFDLKTWRAAQDIKRTAHRADIARLLGCGCVLLETLPSGKMIDWEWDIDPHVVNSIWAHHHDSSNRAHPFLDDAHTLETLAAHLESRHYGLGFSLAFYCCTCGENTIELDAIQDDPICAECETKRQEAIAEYVNEL